MGVCRVHSPNYSNSTTTESEKKRPYDERLARVYKEAMINGDEEGNSGLALVLVRNSTDYDEVQMSEYVTIYLFCEIVNTLFYNQNNGRKPKAFPGSQEDMEIENYRQIEYKLKNGMYILFRHENVERLIELLRENGGDSVYNQGKRSLGNYSEYNKDQLEAVFKYLYNLSQKFFTGPTVPKLSQRSFFEEKLDANSLNIRKFRVLRGFSDPETEARIAGL